MTMNDYERRFQRSLQKLAIPSWYVESGPSSKQSSKQSLLSVSPMPLPTRPEDCSRLPEVIHLRHPRSYRSCRSSLATSPSPSIHSWHPTQMMDGMNFSLQIPSRRCHKYEKGIERVSRSSHWYQPSQFSAKGARKVAALTKHRTTSPIKNHYDTPQLYADDDRGNTERSSIEQTIIRLTNDQDVEKTIANKQNNNVIIIEKNEAKPIRTHDSSSTSVIDSSPSTESTDQMNTVDSIDMQMNKRIPSLEILPLSCGQMEDHDKRRFFPSMSNDSHVSNVPLYEEEEEEVEDDGDDTNSGVRELSNDEDGLRELDENDLSDTDEFIVFAPQTEPTSDHLESSNVPRSSLNRLYTFAKTTDHHAETDKSLPDEQVSPPPSVDKPRQSSNDLLRISSIDAPPTTATTIDRRIDSMINSSPSQLLIHPSSQGVNEETARIGRLLLNSIPIPSVEPIQMFAPSSIARLAPLTLFEPDEQYQSTFNTDPVKEYHRIPEEFDEEFVEDIHHDSGYSSNQERLLIPVSLYEPLSDCYSGFSITQSDFLTTNISSIHSTTDEAYESEPTTMSSSIATTNTTPHVHPDLEHEFDYPSPPPPVPDRRLKPAHLRTPPPTKLHSSGNGALDSAGYSCIQKTKALPLTVIQQWIGSTSNKSPSSSLRTMSSRHYCGSIPTSSDITRTSTYSPSVRTESHSKEKSKEKRPSKTLNCLHSTADDDHERRTTCLKSPSSLHKSKGKKQSTKVFDEATNGLAIRLPAPMTNGHDLNSRQTLSRVSTPTSTRHLNGSVKNRSKVDEFKSIRSPFYETSV